MTSRWAHVTHVKHTCMLDGQWWTLVEHSFNSNWRRLTFTVMEPLNNKPTIKSAAHAQIWANLDGKREVNYGICDWILLICLLLAGVPFLRKYSSIILPARTLVLMSNRIFLAHEVAWACNLWHLNDKNSSSQYVLRCISSTNERHRQRYCPISELSLNTANFRLT